MGGEIFRTCPGRPWGPPSLLYNGYQVVPEVKSGRGVTLTPHPLLVWWSRKSRAIPLLPLWAVRPVQSLSACTRVHFTFSVLYYKYCFSFCMGTVLPFCMGTVPPFCMGTVPPFCMGTVLPFCMGTVLPFCMGTVPPFCMGTVPPF